MEQVGIHAIGRTAFFLHLYRNAVHFGILQKLLAGRKIPFAPRRNHANIRLQRVVAQFKTHLVIAFSGCTVRNSVRASLESNLNLALRYQRPRDTGPEEIFALINSIGSEHWKNIIADKFLTKILNEDLLHTEPFG